MSPQADIARATIGAKAGCFRIGQRVRVKGKLVAPWSFHARRIEWNSDGYVWDVVKSVVEWVNQEHQTFGILGLEVHLVPADGDDRPHRRSLQTLLNLRPGMRVKVCGHMESGRFLAEKVKKASDLVSDEIRGQIRGIEAADDSLRVAGFTVRTDGETSLAAEESATLGQNAFHDMRKLARSEPELLIMDVGANCGQTISDFRNTFENPVIHAFEPGRKAFSQLQRWTAEIPNLHLNNFAVGSRSGQMEFIENRQSVMSSFFEPGVDCSGIINERRQVQVMTLADYCATEGITHIDILKSDTQGFDLEVIKGAGWLLERRRIHLIYLEIIFSEMYKGLPGLDDIYRFLVSHGFRLVSFYQFYYEHNRASWTDALFTNPGFEAPNLNPTGPNGRTARAL